MNQKPVTIAKKSALKPAEDFYRLRRDGIGFIEQMGSRFWTDYNTHDPGITILEALCYALTDLAWRTGWDIKDLLMPQKKTAAASPYAHQAFFTARDILTVNPWTTDDYRRLLIDLPDVRNAWVVCRNCACDASYYAWCDADGQLQLSYEKQSGAAFDPQPIVPRGLYDVLLELEPQEDEERFQKAVAAATAAARQTLHAHRNLDEDFCRISVVAIENVAVCADVEVAADADIDRVQAQIWFEIEQYFNPPIPFYTLQEMLDAGIPVEEIFNGPALASGFIKAEDLAAATLKTVLRVSDIVNRLMDIPGIIAVNNMLLTGYDDDDKIIKGAADPADNGTFDPEKISAAWLLFLEALHQPRLSRRQSRFLFYKNGLPFLPRLDEAGDTLLQLRGAVERPKLQDAPTDLPLPTGTFRDPAAYFPVQYSFPLTYGIGPEGLPSHVSAKRRAQAKQLKAYLLVFEQVLSNAFAQLANTAKLFSLDPADKQTYFPYELNESLIQGYDEIVQGLDETKLKAMTETTAESQERRNRFLDHLMARFGEQFSEYALLLTGFLGQRVARERLIEDKIAFLNAYPTISQQRGRAFNYRTDPCAPENEAGLKQRISRLLGFPDLRFEAVRTGDAVTGYRLTDAQGQPWLEGARDLTTAKARRDFLVRMTLREAYAAVLAAGKYRVALVDESDEPIGLHPRVFETEAEAKAFCATVREELTTWSANERAILVEHLLLRPKFPGDALYPACADGTCSPCDAADPYSFRLTFVMPGWTQPYNVNMEMRQFAERTIRQETPAHLLAKICWVGNDGFIANPCDPVVEKLFDVLRDSMPAKEATCACASTLLGIFSREFAAWYEDKTLRHFQLESLRTELVAHFAAHVNRVNITCAATLPDALWAQIQTIMVAHFHQIARAGWQFERFEDAWCKWLDANAAIDWTAVHLQEEVEAILQKDASASSSAAVCRCAAAILTRCAVSFYNWIEAHLNDGKTPEEFAFTAFAPEVFDCVNLRLSNRTKADLATLLNDHYKQYPAASYHLRVVVDLLANLRNTYPGATLHDCDDGSDVNPMRLDQTALGNYPLRTTDTPDTPMLVMESPIEPTNFLAPPNAKPKTPSKPRKPRKPKQP